MSYIAFDLDALNKAPSAARAARVGEDIIIGGLARMWAHCFREKTDRLERLQVGGFFETPNDVTAALVAFGFLEAAGTAFRVRGAERYLRITEARSKGGKAAVGNLKRGKLKPGAKSETSRNSLPAAAGDQPELTPGCRPALTPTTDDLAPNTESKSTAPAARAPRQSDLLVDDFKAATGTAYLWQGAKDGTALATLLKSNSIDEVRDRWRRGLNQPPGWKQVRTVAQLASKWNDLAEESRKPSEPSKWTGEGAIIATKVAL